MQENLNKNKQEEKIKARKIISGIEKSVNAKVFEPLVAEKIIISLLRRKSIQGTLDAIGDKILNNWVRKVVTQVKFPTDAKTMENMLKSNFYLNKVYRDNKFPIESTSFLNEKLVRFSKREASLLEWIIGFVFVLSKKFGPKYAVGSCENVLINIFTELHPGNEKELETSIAEFQKYLEDKNKI